MIRDKLPGRETSTERLKRAGGRALVLGLAMAMLLTGCGLLRHTAALPGQTVALFVPGGREDQLKPGELQQALMRFADDYSSQVVRAVDEIAAQTNAPISPVRALRFKLGTCTAVVGIASGQNPYANLLDMVTMTTLSRMVLQDYSLKRTGDPVFASWLKVSLRLETNIWSVAQQVLKEEQLAELHKSIESWYASHSEIQSDFFLRALELSSAMPRTLAKESKSGSVFSVMQLDPLSGLDPAVREITETRLFAERSMFVLQRTPFLLRWQTQLLVYELGTQPQMAQALADTTRVSEGIERTSRAAESLSQTAEKLPEQFAAEREAILKELDNQSAKLAALSDSVRQTLLAGEKMSGSLSGAITNLDSLMKRFGVGEPSTSPPNPDAKPFDILDYAKTADQIAAMAKQLNETIREVNTTLDSPALARVSNQATSNARSVLNHAFLLALALVAFIFACAWIYRAASRKQRSE